LIGGSSFLTWASELKHPCRAVWGFPIYNGSYKIQIDEEGNRTEVRVQVDYESVKIPELKFSKAGHNLSSDFREVLIEGIKRSLVFQADALNFLPPVLFIDLSTEKDVKVKIADAKIYLPNHWLDSAPSPQ